jgi:anthranilate synthase component 2
MIGIIDNYDSFTYNLVHYLEDITGTLPLVYKNDGINWVELEKCSHLVLSPGPGLPKKSGELMKVIEKFHNKKNILGVCLGMQALGEYFGGELKNLDEVQHGVKTKIFVEQFEENRLYKGIPKEMEVGRYHSWVVNENKLPGSFLPTAFDEKGNLMSMQHVSLPIYAVQYHPESIMTEFGKQILRNWLD